MKKIINQMIASVLVNSVYAMKGYPTMVISNLLAPVSIIIVVAFASHGTLLGEAVAGGFMMLFISAGLSLQADLSHIKNDFKMQEMIVASPTRAATYLAGMAISELIFIIPSIIVLSVLAVMFIHTTFAAALEVTAVLLVLFIFSLVFGFFLSTFSTDVIQSWSFFGILSVLLTTIPPVYYPITYIPMPWRYLAYISPTTYAAGIVQNALGYLKLSVTMLAIDWIVTVVTLALLLAVAIKKNRWREE